MEQALIRQLKDGTLAPYRAAARAKGRSLEAELRELIESNVPTRMKDPARLAELAGKLRRNSLDPNDDSAADIRRVRDGDGDGDKSDRVDG